VPYWALQPAAFNSHSILLTRRDELSVLDRASGNQRVYTLDRFTKRRIYGMRLQGNPIAGLVADEGFLFFSSGNRVFAYDIPRYDIQEKAPPPKDDDQAPAAVVEGSLRPDFEWSYGVTGTVIEHPPLVHDNQVSAMGSDGTLISLNKYDRVLRFDFQTTGAVSAPMGQYRSIAYIGSEDYALYALNMSNERLMWRFIGGGPIKRKPSANDQDVFFKAEGTGLYRIDRQTGREMWVSKQADRFLAANQDFVYTLDARSKMLIHDHARGTILGQYDMSEWQVPVPNEHTDRLYFANHDGQVLCLFHRDNLRPLRMKTPESKKKPPEKKEDKKEDEKKEEKVGSSRPASTPDRERAAVVALPLSSSRQARREDWLAHVP
jgi:outer membrane protein assembly factor BamB